MVRRLGGLGVPRGVKSGVAEETRTHRVNRCRRGLNLLPDGGLSRLVKTRRGAQAHRHPRSRSTLSRGNDLLVGLTLVLEDNDAPRRGEAEWRAGAGAG